MASFGGANIWGIGVVTTTSQTPAAVQFNEYPQIHGVEAVHLGGRGRVTNIEGFLVGESPQELAAAENVIRLHHEAGTVAPFLDNLGAGSLFAIIASYDPSGPVQPAPGPGVYLQRYRATVRHLV